MRQRLERRLTAILAADVVGYSRLAGVDEVGTMSALQSCRAELIGPKTAQWSGRTIKLMGDGMLMEFPSVREAGIPEDRQIFRRVAINISDKSICGVRITPETETEDRSKCTR